LEPLFELLCHFWPSIGQGLASGSVVVVTGQNQQQFTPLILQSNLGRIVSFQQHRRRSILLQLLGSCGSQGWIGRLWG
jgi:hypothetical protein